MVVLQGDVLTTECSIVAIERLYQWTGADVRFSGELVHFNKAKDLNSLPELESQGTLVYSLGSEF